MCASVCVCVCVCVCVFIRAQAYVQLGGNYFFFFLIEEKSIFALIGFGNLDSEGKLALVCELDWLLIMTLLVQI